MTATGRYQGLLQAPFIGHQIGNDSNCPPEGAQERPEAPAKASASERRQKTNTAGGSMARDQRGEPELPPGPARDLVDLYRRLRLSTKLTGGQIAVKARLSAGHVSDVLRGHKAPGPDTAAKIANALGARMEEIQLARRLAEELAEL